MSNFEYLQRGAGCPIREPEPEVVEYVQREMREYGLQPVGTIGCNDTLRTYFFEDAKEEGVSLIDYDVVGGSPRYLMTKGIYEYRKQMAAEKRRLFWRAFLEALKFWKPPKDAPHPDNPVQ